MDCNNPYIEAFCRALIEKNEGKLDSDAKDKLVEDLYRLYENMLGRNIVAALPEEKRSQFISEYDKGNRPVDLDQFGELFGDHITDPQEIMKKTLIELAALYFKNR
jgi:hypothetical protein